MVEMMFKPIFDEKLLDKKFCKYLEKRLEDNVVDELQIEIQILIGNIVPRTWGINQSIGGSGLIVTFSNFKIILK